MNTFNKTGGSQEGKKLPDLQEHTAIGVLTKEVPTESNQITIPKIELPKGGGAIRSIDEKFSVNAANGTASLNIPLPITPGRQGFAPSLGLGYSSGAGNGIFGLGWSLNLQQIARKTDKGIPTYRDEDVFIFSGAEDLVPYLIEDGPGNWVKDIQTSGDYTITRYRPRLTSDHSRIEMIEHSAHGTYWRVMTADNVTTLYGRTPETRISDPEDERKVFKWLPEFSYDDKGNWIRYSYKGENLEQVPDLLQEKNRRNGLQPFTNLYLKRINYGNVQPYLPDPDLPYDPSDPGDDTCYFELVFDYGEHDTVTPLPAEAPDLSWTLREDPFSSYRSGFEIRTYRLCKRVLMFHHFPDEINDDGSDFGNDYLVRSLEFVYAPSSINNSGQAEVNYLSEVIPSGYVRKGDGSYSKKSLPALMMEYSHLQWNSEIRQASRSEIENMPVGLSDNYQWVDLYGEGISGLLTEQGEGWYYKENLGDTDGDGSLHFGGIRQVAPKPSFTGLGSGEITVADLDADGLKEIVTRSGGVQGYFSIGTDGKWQPFRSFLQVANIDLSDPNVRVFDITGDGKPDLVMTEERVITYYEGKGKEGFAAHASVLKALDEEHGPALVFADENNKVMLADMSGDGLTDIVRIRNGEVCYWPNLGYGRFGTKVTMGNVPHFDLPDRFNPIHLHLADISGTGAADIIYQGNGWFQAYLNLSGNALSDLHVIEPFFPVDNMVNLQAVDLFGTGTTCLVWSSNLPGDTSHPLRYIDLMSSSKPHVLTAFNNNIGQRTTLSYRSSTHFYLKDKLAGNPWVTKLPFPVQVVEQFTVEDAVTNVRFATRYTYHHGFYDHQEREFRGFGMVEQLDSEHYTTWKDENSDSQLEQSEETFQAPVLTKTWYHTGAFIRKDLILDYLKNEYWPAQYEHYFPGELGTLNEPDLPDAVKEVSAAIQDPYALDKLIAQEHREASQACKGMVLRQEVFALDAVDPENPSDDERRKQLTPYTVTAHNCRVILQQPLGDNKHACFQVLERETFTANYERNPADPRITHDLNIETDRYGNVLNSASITYARFTSDLSLPQKVRETQARTHIVYKRNSYTNDVIAPDSYRLRSIWETEVFELSNIPKTGVFYTFADFTAVLGTATTEIPYQQSASSAAERRKIEHIRHLFLRNDLSGPLAPGLIQSHGMRYESYALAYTPALLTDLFGSLLPAPNYPSTDGFYVHFLGDTDWWVPSGTQIYLMAGETEADARNRFFTPIGYRDAAGSEVSITFYKNYYFLIQSNTDALGNTIKAENFNFRTLAAVTIRDANDTLTAAVLDELGKVKATALLGKDLDGDGIPEVQLADNLSGINEWTDDEEAAIQAYFQQTDAVAIDTAARNFLRQATSRYLYNLDAWNTNQKPVAACSILRETHHADLETEVQSALKITFEYTDGLGNVAMVKSKAEPGSAKQTIVQENGQYTVTEVDTSPAIRWLGNGRTILNNKGNLVKQYQPYFSVTPAYEDAPELVEIGETFTIYYDSLGRHTRTLFPDKALQEIRFNAWKKEIWDQNDMALASAWYNDRFNRLIDAQLMADGKDPAKEETAAAKTAAHDATPSVVHYDTLGRPVMTVAHNKRPDNSDEFIQTSVDLDIEGNTLSVTDARNNTVMTYRYDMLGHRVYSYSMDAGERWQFANALGKLMLSRDERNHTIAISYDALHREVEKRVTGGDGTHLLDHLFEKLIYGEGQTNDKALNLRGKVWHHYDTAGKVESVAYDQKGNLVHQFRKFAQNYKSVPDWSMVNPDNALQAGIGKETTITYDALNRVTEKINPDGSKITNRYNEAGLLDRVEVTRGDDTVLYVKNIDYNEKGQRKSIIYGNDVKTTYTYDRETFRLLTITSRRKNNDLLQELHYTYDAVGNITEIEDKAIPTKFFANQVVQPRNRYTYDAVYRLREAQGKEHIAQVNYNACDNWNDLPFLKKYNTNDDMLWRNYTQRYTYDLVGNILEMRHIATNGNWTRTYSYEANTNRLTQTKVGAQTYHYNHHPAHGFLTSLPHLQDMGWNFRDELSHSSTQQVCTGESPETTYYVYNGAGKRVRKITENQSVNGNPPTVKEERQYVWDVEIYTKVSGNHIGLERTTLHISDDQGRIAMLDMRNGVNDGTDQETIRYQLGNRSNSAHLELNHQGEVISYEEYHPYGTTAYQAVNATIKAAAKRYRYTGMERDNETGLCYHNARYYMPWLGRWLKPDPAEIQDGVNVFVYARDNPVNRMDESGLLSWGQVFGIAAAVVVGTVVTVATAGLAGPVVGAAAATVIGGIVGGAAGAATGEVVEALVDGRPVTAENVGRAALTGAVVGGIFAGAGAGIRAALSTQAGRQIAARVASSPVGQAVLRRGYAVAGSAVGRAYRSVSEAIRRNIQQPAEEVGERIASNVGQQLERSRVDTVSRAGTRMTERAVESRTARETVQSVLDDIATDSTQTQGGRARASIRGEINGDEVAASTRSGQRGSTSGQGSILDPETGESIAAAPRPGDTPLQSFPFQSAGGNYSAEAGFHAEFKLLGFSFLRAGTDPAAATGRLYLGASFPFCNSCTAGIAQTRALLPGVDILSVHARFPVAGAVSPTVPLLVPDDNRLAPEGQMLQLEFRFGR